MKRDKEKQKVYVKDKETEVKIVITVVKEAEKPEHLQTPVRSVWNQRKKKKRQIITQKRSSKSSENESPECYLCKKKKAFKGKLQKKNAR